MADLPRFRSSSWLWARAREIFGEAWDAAHGAEDDGRWLRALAPLSSEQIRNGLRVCLARRADGPPSLDLFVSRCRSIPAASSSPRRGWRRPTAAEVERGRSAIAEARRLLASGR